MAVQGPSQAGSSCHQSRTITQTRPPPTRSRRLNIGECFCICETLFRKLLRQNSNSLLSLLKALAFRLLDCLFHFCSALNSCSLKNTDKTRTLDEDLANRTVSKVRPKKHPQAGCDGGWACSNCCRASSCCCVICYSRPHCRRIFSRGELHRSRSACLPSGEPISQLFLCQINYLLGSDR